MRRSNQRDAILRLVRETDTHPSAEWIYEQARKDIPDISLGTVYRNLSQLAAAGMILRIFDNGHTRYDGNSDRHDHVRCTSCGRLFDVHVPVSGIAAAVSRNVDFHVTGYSLEITGFCNECRQTQEET